MRDGVITVVPCECEGGVENVLYAGLLSRCDGYLVRLYLLALAIMVKWGRIRGYIKSMLDLERGIGDEH